MAKQENPFYHNYLWSEADLSRVMIKWWQYPLLWLLPTYVQINDGYAFFYKQWGNQYFFMKEERLSPLPEKEEE